MTDKNKRRGVRWWLRRNLPEPLRRQIAILRRSLRDNALGRKAFVTSTSRRTDQTFIARIYAAQPIRQTDHAFGKIENLRLAVIGPQRLVQG
jgi:broad specificity phosphatase PhoE